MTIAKKSAVKTTIANKPIIQKANSASPKVGKRPPVKTTIANVNKKTTKVVVKPQAAKSPVVKAEDTSEAKIFIKPVKTVTQAPAVPVVKTEPEAPKPGVTIKYREESSKGTDGTTTTSDVS